MTRFGGGLPRFGGVRPQGGSHPAHDEEFGPTTVTGRYHRPPGGWLILAALLVPLLLALLGPMFTPRGSSTSNRTTGDTASPAPSVASVGEALRVTTDDGRRVVSGRVPDQASKKALLDGARAASDGFRVVDEVEIADGVDAPPVTGVGTILAAAHGVKDLGLVVDRGSVTLSGTADEQNAATSAVFAAGQSYPGVRLVDQLRINGGGATPAAAATPLTAECEQIRTDVAAGLKNTPIKFELNGTKVDPSSQQQLVDYGRRMSSCHFNAVEVAGHTDATGGEAVNRRLSQQRAESVRDVLVQAGVSDQVITAKGYGPSKPIADNSTPQGQAANRRVEINAS